MEIINFEDLEAFNADRDSPEWNEAWDALIVEFGEPECMHPVYGERWQYIDTRLTQDGWKHVFRHRAFPTTDQEEWRSYSASVPMKHTPLAERNNP